MIKALIFDFDGLIVDTEICVYDTWQVIFQALGATLPLEEWAKCIGATDEHWDVVDFLETQTGPVDRPALRQLQRAQELERAYAQPLLPGVQRYLDDACALGLQIGLASSSNRAWVMTHLEKRGITDYFTSVRAREDVANAKPAPDLFQAVLADFNLRPDEALVLEDSPNGILAAKRAGIRVVAVPNSLTAQLDTSLADMRLSSMAEMPLANVLTYFNDGHG
jgi:HAD superfamily hydrolase (TIGR01509 family)